MGHLAGCRRLAGKDDGFAVVSMLGSHSISEGLQSEGIHMVARIGFFTTGLRIAFGRARLAGPA